MDNIYIILAAAFLAGAATGWLYFAGLWWTLERLGPHPLRRAAASFALRTLAAAAVFYLLLQWRWEALAVGMAGFLLARMIAIRRWGPDTVRRPPKKATGESRPAETPQEIHRKTAT